MSHIESQRGSITVMATTVAARQTVLRRRQWQGTPMNVRSVAGAIDHAYATRRLVQKNKRASTDQKTDQTRQRAYYTCHTRDGHVYCANARTDKINVDTRKHEHIRTEKVRPLRLPPKTHSFGAVQFDDGHHDKVENAGPIKSSPS